MAYYNCLSLSGTHTHTHGRLCVCVCGRVFSFSNRDQMSLQWHVKWSSFFQMDTFHQPLYSSFRTKVSSDSKVLTHWPLLWMKQTLSLISILMQICVCMFVFKWTSTNGTTYEAICQMEHIVCAYVCLFEVPQRYQTLAHMPKWTYCRLGWGTSDHLATMRFRCHWGNRKQRCFTPNDLKKKEK